MELIDVVCYRAFNPCLQRGEAPGAARGCSQCGVRSNQRIERSTRHVQLDRRRYRQLSESSASVRQLVDEVAGGQVVKGSPHEES
jgi:hypothetical protein